MRDSIRILNIRKLRRVQAMRMSQGVEWAVHACTVLAPLPPGRGLSLAALAEFHGVPPAYMAKQMQALSRAGIVRTSRGKTGGYALARPASEITLWQVARAIDGPEPAFRCSEIRQRGPCAAKRKDCRHACPIAAAFAVAEAAWRGALEAVTIAGLVAEVGATAKPDHIGEILAWFGSNVTELPGG
jgi:Rrf2 family protein